MEIILTGFGLMLLVQIIKKYSPTLSGTWIHVLVFALGLGIVVVKGLAEQFPTFGTTLQIAGGYLVSAIAIYEVIWKRLSEKLNLGL